MRSLQRDPLYLELVHFYMIIYVHLYVSNIFGASSERVEVCRRKKVAGDGIMGVEEVVI